MDGLTKFAPRPTGVGEMFQLLRDGRPRTRAELAQITGHGRSTIAARVDLLLSAGLVVPAGEATSTGGRPPATFVFRTDARIVLAIDLGATHVRLAVTDLASTVLAEHQEAVRVADGPDVVLDRIGAIGTELIAGTGRSIIELASVGVGLPAPVDHASGRPISPPIMPGWDGADVPAQLRRWFRVPVLVDNDVNIMALGERRTQYPHVDHLLFVKVATGIGAGVISDGALRRGAQGAAGDIGHIAVPSGPDVMCHCGNYGCLEAIASGGAIAESLARAGVPATNGADVVALVKAGNSEATQAVREAGRTIGSVLAGSVSMLNPSVIVIGGNLASAGEFLLAGIREVVYRRSPPLATQHLRIVASRTKGRAGVLGASAMAAEAVLSPTAVEALIP